MPITIPSASVETFSSPTATSHTMNLATASPGDVRVVVIAANPDGTGAVPAVNIPAGWTEIGSQLAHGAASDGLLAIIRRVVQGGDGTTVVVTTTQTCMMAGIATTYVGVDNTTPLDATPPTFNTGSSPPDSPSITTVTDNARVCWAVLVDGVPTWDNGSIPPGSTLRGTMVNNPPSNGQNLGSADENQATPGASGLGLWNDGGTEEYVAATFALRPAPEGGSFDQTSFRGRNDDGSESAATWKAAANTNWNQAQDENFRVRFLIQEDADVEDLNVQFQLQYNLNAAGWNDVNGSSSVVRSSASPNITGGGNTTQQIGAGTFIGTQGGLDESNGLTGGANMDFSTTVNEETEIEYCVQIRSADTRHSDTIQLRILKEPDIALDVYTNTPTITIPLGRGLQLVSADRLLGTAALENPGTFNFERSLPWGAITLALRPSGVASASSFTPNARYTSLVGDLVNTDDTIIDGWTITGNVQLDAVIDVNDVTIVGDLVLSTAGTYNFSNVTVTGDITNSDAAGNAVINASNGSTLTTSEPGTGNGEVSIINNVTLLVEARDASTNAVIENVRIYIEADSGGPLTAGDEIMNALTNVSGIVQDTAFNFSSNQPILGRARKGTSPVYYKTSGISGTITSAGLTVTVFLVRDA